MKRLQFILTGLSFLAVSCITEKTEIYPERPDEEITDSAGDLTVSFIINDFIPEESTKSMFDESDRSFRWSSDDAVGIFPEEGYQTEFLIQDGAGSNKAVFDGGSWGLKKNATYYAYYPFSTDNFENKEKREYVGISYAGQEACFADEDGFVNLSKYDFMASGGSTVGEDGKVSFNFRHLGALCRITMVVPNTGIYKKVVIEAQDYSALPVSAYYDATGPEEDGTFYFPEVNTTETLEIAFPESHNSFTAGETIVFYFLMLPVDLTEQPFRFKLFDDMQDAYVTSFEGKKVEAGKAYGWNIAFERYVAPAGYEPANCIIVSEPGTYSFPTVKGNSANYISDVASAVVLWESFGTSVAPAAGDLIPEVTYSDRQITFTTSPTFNEGNAVIAAKNELGHILWSWHIWFTDKPQDETYLNGAGTMMDRNLGATSADPGNVGALGLLYQWGRKDPFPGSSSISEGRMAISVSRDHYNNWTSETSSESTGTVDYAISNPMTFLSSYFHDEGWNYYDWIYTEGYVEDHFDRWKPEKTIYDPCPAGYRVPDGGYEGVWAKALGRTNSYDNILFDTADYGVIFNSDEYHLPLTSSGNVWYPAAGCMYVDEESELIVSDTGLTGDYWSCTLDGWGRAYNLYIMDDSDRYPGWGYMDITYISNYAAGLSVRCQKIQ